MSLVALFFFSPLILIIIHTWRSNNKRSNTTLNIPKGSTGWPFIGELIPLLKPHPSIHMSPFIEQRISKYGKIFRSQLPGRRVIFSGDAELNRIVLQNTGQVFKNDWPRNFVGLFGKYNLSLLEGEAHKVNRSLFVSFLSIERIRGGLLREVDRQASLILDSWKENSLVFFEETRKFAFNTAFKFVMNCDANNPEVDQLRGEYINLNKGLASLPFNFPGTTYRKALQSRSNILKYINKKVKERQQQINDGSEGNADDLLSFLLNQIALSEEEIADHLLSFIFAAHDTLSSVIPLAIYFLEGCQRAVDQLREEHLHIRKMMESRGETELNWTDYKLMEFTQCVIDETLRLGNVVRYLPKKVTKTTQFKGYEIPSGYTVIPAIAAVHMDPSLFDDPQCFNPWRWQRKSSNPARTNNIMSFGGGQRLCPGMELAKVELSVFIHRLVLAYVWETEEPDPPMALPMVDFARGLPMKIRPYMSPIV
ncbi:Cytochrome P450 90B1 [Acorus calamus]|uniref:Cytochrome P450 90B1 n=1 Tax=Acorus calamus TaxID=4465 RepID=A0AAV9CH88_ACOCL|nr:Cytochrome P450 90B1 [Acorus calamus]